MSLCDLRQTRRKARVYNPHEKITSFPQVKGKVVREVCFSHDEANNVLIIDFKDRTGLYFDINPKALILPLEVSAHYIGKTRSTRKTWERAAEE